VELTRDQKWIIKDMGQALHEKIIINLRGCNFFDFTDNEVEALAIEMSKELVGVITKLAESKE